MNKLLVVSAVNLVDGGTIEILRQCLQEAVQLPGWRVVAIVNSAQKVGVEGVRYIERPDVKPSWWRRIWFEYVECRALARELRPDFWLALHDLSPSLSSPGVSVPQAVYCHNAMCFYRLPWREMRLEPKLLPFAQLYALFYRINIRRNAAVIVQQDWIRTEFKRRFGCRNVVVAHPAQGEDMPRASRIKSGRRFFYPSYARAFKNFETVLEAWARLCADAAWDGQLILTVDEYTNAYGRDLHRRYGHLRNLQFVGRVPRAEMDRLYADSDCLVFASKLETWGLPLSEAKQAGLFIFASDLPYAHEAIGDYDGAAFFPPTDAVALAGQMRAFRDGRIGEARSKPLTIEQPFAANWKRLFELILPDRTTF